MQAKTWHYFIYTQIMPSTLNSVVTKKRVFLTYAILKGVNIVVGKIINEEIHSLVNLKGKRKLWGFYV